MTTTRLAVLGGGAAGVGLVWSLAMGKKLGLLHDDLDITLMHDGDAIGGHSMTMTESIDGAPRALDLGVQVIAPAMYPTVSTMLTHPDFAGVTLDPVDLHISCAFPDTTGGSTYWGNFPAYQGTGLYKRGKADAATFERLLAAVPRHDPVAMGLAVQTFLQSNASEFDDLTFFETYFLNPYMSIMNGYGQALLDEVIVGDLIPLFDGNLASFTEPTSGFARFHDGAAFWVQTMADKAQSVLGAALTIELHTTVTAMQASEQGPRVRSHTGGGQPIDRTFDLVVSSLDMQGNSLIMSGQPGWEVFQPYIGDTTAYGTTVWPLQPGFCYLHQDPSVLAPGLPSPPGETMQFTAPPTSPGQPFDLTYSYTTYVESNLLGLAPPAPSADLYLTMYGFDPTTNPSTPVPTKGVKMSMDWVHGMWLPTFMADQKLAFHAAQGVSPHYPPIHSQHGSRIFFAGNNLTMDSEEGALLSGFAIAKYAFGFDPMLTLLPNPDKKDIEHYAEAVALFEAFFELMFAPEWAQKGPGPVVHGGGNESEQIVGRIDHILARRPPPAARRPPPAPKRPHRAR